MKTIMQGRDILNKNGNEKMKKTHIQIITLIMLMSVSTEYLQASSAQSAAASRIQAARARQARARQANKSQAAVSATTRGTSSASAAAARATSSVAANNNGITLGNNLNATKIQRAFRASKKNETFDLNGLDSKSRFNKENQTAAQPAPSLWSRTKAATANIFGKSAKVAPEPTGKGIALKSTNVDTGDLFIEPQEYTSKLTDAQAPKYDRNLGDGVGTGTLFTESASYKRSLTDAQAPQYKEPSYYERAKTAVNNAASAVYNAPGNLSVKMGGKQDFITNRESGSLRSLSGYDKYNKKAGQPGEAGWNFRTKANQNYNRKADPYMATTPKSKSAAAPKQLTDDVVNPMSKSASFADFENSQTSTGSNPFGNTVEKAESTPSSFGRSDFASTNSNQKINNLNKMTYNKTAKSLATSAQLLNNRLKAPTKAIIRSDKANQRRNDNADKANQRPNDNANKKIVQESLSRAESPQTVADFFDTHATATAGGYYE